MEKIAKSVKKKLSSAEFDKFCQENFSKDMSKLEDQRKYYLIAIGAIILISVIIFICYLIYNYKVHNTISFNSDNILFIIPFALCYVIMKHYKKRAKDIILEKLLSFVGDFHIQNEKLSDSYLHCLKLFNNFNSYSCEDRLKGKYNDLDVDIAEIELSKFSKNKSSNAQPLINNNHKNIIFKGILIVVPSYKKYEGFTIVKKNFNSKDVDRLKDVQKVILEDPEFGKLYDVYSTNQIEARYLLTTAFMNRMVRIADKHIGNKIMLSFEQGNINLALESKKDWFEVPILKKTEIKDYKAIVMELVALLSIIESLKLDQNIGM